jgi:glutamate-5-semialdehyde dehydrogenase
VKPAEESDWSAEYNDLILSVKIVDSYEDAVGHINKYSSHHTDSIVTGNSDTAEYFINFTDSSSVMWNCSTRFSDGYRYGLGAEVGISTNKIHSRGPVGLEGLTIYKYRLVGKGQIVADYADSKKKFTHREI